MPCFHSVNPLLPHFKTFPFIDELILIYLSCESNPFKLGANPRILFIDFDTFSLILKTIEFCRIQTHVVRVEG